MAAGIGVVEPAPARLGIDAWIISRMSADLRTVGDRRSAHVDMPDCDDLHRGFGALAGAAALDRELERILAAVVAGVPPTVFPRVVVHLIVCAAARERIHTRAGAPPGARDSPERCRAIHERAARRGKLRRDTCRSRCDRRTSQRFPPRTPRRVRASVRANADPKSGHCFLWPPIAGHAVLHRDVGALLVLRRARVPHHLHDGRARGRRRGMSVTSAGLVMALYLSSVYCCRSPAAGSPTGSSASAARSRSAGSGSPPATRCCLRSTRV